MGRVPGHAPVTKPMVPDSSSQEYLWWSAGANDEAKARNEGMNGDARQLRDMLEGLARMHPDWAMARLALSLAMIACPDKLRRKERL